MKAVELVKEFLVSEKAGGFILILCTLFSLIVSNSGISAGYIQLWNYLIAGETFVHWVNDGLMTLFFLVIGLELKKEFVEGQFANLKNAMLPLIAAIGGMLLPAGFHLLFNYGTATQSGAGIPMATDAAFALAILSLVGKRAPFALKMLLLAIAVIDDLCAIIVIAIFYTGGPSWLNIGLALATFTGLILMNRFGIKNLFFYLAGGVLMWYFMLHSGIHATISGVLLALTVPHHKNNEHSPSSTLQHRLHYPVAFIILPLFALANTSISLYGHFLESLSTANSIGIMTGLIIGKPLGVFLFSLLAIRLGIGSLPAKLNWKHVLCIGILAGIGFTISIFISLLAFQEESIIDQSKIAVLTASVITAALAFIWLCIITRSDRVIVD
jgi:NhaA family Na+:H+ antiporter